MVHVTSWLSWLVATSLTVSSISLLRAISGHVTLLFALKAEAFLEDSHFFLISITSSEATSIPEAASVPEASASWRTTVESS